MTVVYSINEHHVHLRKTVAANAFGHFDKCFRGGPGVLDPPCLPGRFAASLCRTSMKSPTDTPGSNHI